MTVPFENLSAKQKKVVKHQDGPLLVLAGPGTGKTEVLTHRISCLVSKRRVPPENILAITFSRKAAKEMADRVTNDLGVKEEQLRVSTLHAESLRLLKEIGKSRKFLVADDEAWLLIKDAARDVGQSTSRNSLKYLADKIRLFKANNKLPNEVEVSNDQAKRLKKFYQRYEELLDFNKTIDLDGLVLKVVRVLNPSLNNQEVHLLVDEYQDINQAEYKLIQILAEGAESLFVVGDDDQSIYGWRGADPSIIRSFKKDFKNSQVVVLEHSHRCPGNILKGAYAIVAKDPNCIPKTVCSSKGDGPPINILLSRSYTAEAFWITEWIEKYLAKDGTKPGHIAILTKSLKLAEFVMEQLRNTGTKATYWRSGGFFSNRNVLDILAHIRLIIDKEDNLALRRCTKTSTGRGIGDGAERRLCKIAEKNKCSLWEFVLDAQKFRELRTWRKSFKAFVNKINDMEKKFPTLGPGQIVQFIAKEMGTNRLSNVKKLEDFGKSLSEDASLKDFLAELDKNRGVDLAGGGPEPEIKEEAVAIMSMHSAKGLGFKVVFIIGMDDGIMPDLDQDEYEQRRLCYVAMTRAKEELFLCHAKMRKGPIARGISYYNPSRFLYDIPKNCIKVINKY